MPMNVTFSKRTAVGGRAWDYYSEGLYRRPDPDGLNAPASIDAKT